VRADVAGSYQRGKFGRIQPDGLKVVSASDDETVRNWSVATGECEQTMQGHTNPVNSATFSPEGRQIVSAGGDKTMRVWDAAGAGS
jgi:WD40 repeat protein